MTSRMLVLTGAAFLLLLSAMVPVLAAEPRPGWVIPTTATVRSGPGQNYSRIGSVSRGTKVYVLAFRDKWCQCKLLNGAKGWIAEWLLEFSVSKGRALAAEAGEQPRSTPAKPAWVKRDDVNVRSGPGLTSDTYGTISRGTKVYIVETRGDWRKCRTPGGYGWIRGDMLELDAEAGRKLAASKGSSSGSSGGVESAKGFIKGDNVRLREKPSISGGIVATLDSGQTVYIVDRHRDWYRLRVHGGRAGWVHSDLVKLAGSGSSGGSTSSSGAAPMPQAPPNFPSPCVEARPLRNLPADEGMEVEAWTAGDGVCVRSGPSLGAGLKTKLPAGTKVVVTGVSDHWAYARLSDGDKGWIAGWLLNYTNPQQCNVTDSGGETYPVRVGWVARPEVNVRSGPGLEYATVATVGLGAKFLVLERTGQWYRAAFSNGAVGWIASWLVDTREQRLARQRRLAMVASGQVQSGSPLTSALETASEVGAKVVRLAATYLGYPYVRGGESPSGFDCSGFVRYVMRQFGIDCSHDSRVLFRQGTPVARGQLQPGDVVFFKNTYRKGISHVGIYIGDRQFIHASTHRTGVRTSSLDKPYYVERYAGARRMF